MKVNLTSNRGVVSDPFGSSIQIEGREYHEAPFDNRWDDLNGEIHEGTGAAGLTYEEYRNTNFNLRFFRHNQNDNIFVVYQMPHSWYVSSSIYPHIHFIPMSNGSGNAIFEFVYTWNDVNQILPDGTSWTTGSITASLTPSNQYQHMVRHFGAIVPLSSTRESSLLFMKIERPGSSNVGDTYQTSKDHQTAAANIGILFFDLHYQKIRAGTTTQFPEDPSFG